MKHSLDSQYLELFSQQHGAVLAHQLVEIDAPARSIPAAWLEVVNHPTELAVRKLWADAAAYLPRFIDYLATSIQGAAVVEAYGTPALLIALPDWDEDPRGPLPGFCWMGPPTPVAAIARFVADVGEIPLCLEALWKVASFINTKQPSMICSLDPSTRQLADEPSLLPLSREDEASEWLECLKIAVVNGQMTTCMTRAPGQTAWQDSLAIRFTHSGELSWAVCRTLDNLLIDASAL